MEESSCQMKRKSRTIHDNDGSEDTFFFPIMDTDEQIDKWLESWEITQFTQKLRMLMCIVHNALVKAAIEQGLHQNIAEKLVYNSMIGSAKLAKSSGETLTKLRENVTSEGGTTEAALSVLMQDDALKNIIIKVLNENSCSKNCSNI